MIGLQDDSALRPLLQTKTDAEGRFVFEDVLPGEYQIARQVELDTNDSAWDRVYSHGKKIDCTSGETLQVVLGGDGVDLRGKIRLPSVEHEAHRSLQPLVELQRIPDDLPWPDDLKNLPDGHAKRLDWLQKRRESDAGIDYGEKHPVLSHEFYRTWCDDDGNYLLECIPPGEYVMIVWQWYRESENGREAERIILQRRVVVPTDE